MSSLSPGRSKGGSTDWKMLLPQLLSCHSEVGSSNPVSIRGGRGRMVPLTTPVVVGMYALWSQLA